ncbi:recombination protein RecR [Actinomyces sp. zg-332]|uniref:recombination mediator RecR n=1 Tax=Actinomyces sp. zg-332 TaxID=2708340 RepID=UPI0014249DE7|nr:recombination mediator RecR [Actinomyces sp. zg-332]QPK94214.1 recombination protein RecR [Actinomyces sp. zg-332]
MYENALQTLIDELGQLPGVGPKSAQRMALHILQAEEEYIEALLLAIKEVKEKIVFCEICGNLASDKLCGICANPKRDKTVICVVEEAKDIMAIEKTRSYRGVYHVLGGVLDLMNGIGPNELRIAQLLSRLSDTSIEEVIIATNPNTLGEATATYIARTLHALEIKTSRLASGLPMGSDLEYADEITIGKAFEGRRSI